MFKKIFIAMFSLILMIWISQDSVSAMENSSSNLENEILIAESFVESDFSIEEASIDGVTPLLSFNISSSSLGVNKFVKSSNSYYIQSGGKVNITNITWSPSNQNIQIGLVNAATDTRYWSSERTGGSQIGGSIVLPETAPSGQYYVAIRSVATNTTSISVYGQFNF
ncbi:hypothetical protein [Lysinibacillus sp. FSL P2-0066]|uniref:hypothetical protein n=1 Tax=Lysinibacillus sp. FSL P2-0066 TaxID=2921720 RepID=UPI0030D8CD54